MAERTLDYQQLHIALSYLTEEQRQVIILKFVDELDNAATAKVLGKSEGAIKSLQHRALAALRKRLEDLEAGDA